MNHPLFWTNRQCLDFLRVVSNYVDQSPQDVRDRFEQIMTSGMDPSWKTRVGEVVWKHVTSFRPYSESSYVHLVRAIRNLYEHWSSVVLSQTPKDILVLMGENPDGIAAYFTSKFPRLMANLWTSTLTIEALSRLKSV